MENLKNYCKKFFCDNEEGEEGAELLEIVVGIGVVAALAAVVFGIIAIVSDYMDSKGEEIKNLDGNNKSPSVSTTAPSDESDLVIDDDEN